MVLANLNPATMTAGALFIWIVLGVGAILIAVLAYFLKREKDRGDKTESTVHELEITTVKKEEFNKMEDCVSKIKEDYVTKADLRNELSLIHRQLDRIIDILLKRKEQDNG